MVNLLESMHKCCLPSGIPSQSPSAYEKSLVHRIFGGRLRSQVRCASCSHCSSKFDPFLDLSLEIADSATLVKALQKFTEEEVLDGGEEQYNCQSCKRKVVAKKRFTIDKAPDVLTIHLKRFSPFNPRHKIDKKVEFQPTLNLKPFVSNSEDMDFRYSLYGVLVHAGWNTQSGHYYCFVRTSSGLWHNLDDNQVRQVREADVLRQKAYMLFYVRDRVRSSMMNTNFIEKKAISEKIACMNDSLRNGLREATLNVSPFINGDMKSQKQNLDNGHPTIFGNSSRGQCSKKPSSIEVLEAAAVQSNDMISVQEALCIQPDTAATLSINTNKTTSDSQSEIISPPYLFGESTLDINKAAAKDTTVPDGTVSCWDEAKAAAESVKQHDEIVMDKELPAEHFDAISNPVEQTSVQTNTAEAGQATLKELSVKDTDHITNAEEPFSVQNNNLEAVQVNPLKQICSENSTQVICSEVSAHAICSEASAQATCSEEVSAQATCSEVSAQAICSEVSAQATCSGNSAQAICSEDSAQAICSEDSTKVLDQVPCHDNPNTVTDLKSSKQVAYSTARLLFVSKHSLLAVLKQHKKRKHKRATRRPIDNDELVTDDQQPSTSETVLRVISCKSHRRRKRSHEKSSSDNGDKMNSKKPHLAEPSSSTADLPMDRKDDKDALLGSTELPSSHASSVTDQHDNRSHEKSSSDNDDKMNSKKPHLAEPSSSTADLPMDRKDDKDALVASAKLPSSHTSSVTDQNDSRNCAHPNEVVSRHFDLLTRGLGEITVQRWDDIDMPNTKSTKFSCPRTNIIGYVPDQWDEEYDRGKMKKVRKPKEEEFGGPNPFQEAANIRSRLRKRFKCDQDRWGNQPRRI
ncbi:ubiquitin carboxyl-terminal hydrolase 23-like [Lolium rigidum]|nr:ubiquitin carboxyl-terminal hydrolase 23-like [Lolium rigidum]